MGETYIERLRQGAVDWFGMIWQDVQYDLPEMRELWGRISEEHKRSGHMGEFDAAALHLCGHPDAKFPQGWKPSADERKFLALFCSTKPQEFVLSDFMPDAPSRVFVAQATATIAYLDIEHAPLVLLYRPDPVIRAAQVITRYCARGVFPGTHRDINKPGCPWLIPVLSLAYAPLPVNGRPGKGDVK